MDLLRIIIFLLGVVCVVLFIPPLIIYRILNIGNATGLFAGLLFIAYGIFPKKISVFFQFLWKSIPGKTLVIFAGGIVICCILLAVIISSRMIQTVHQKPEDDVPLPVPGCQVKGTKPGLMLTERLEAAKDYPDTHANAVCILSFSSSK